MSLFAAVAAAHWEEARTCEKQKRMPSLRRQRAIEEGVDAACARFWPGHDDYRLRVFAFILSEGNGLADGNPADPSYGVGCVHVQSGQEAARFWNIIGPRGRGDFEDRLRNDDRWCVMIAAGELALKEQRMGGDWLAAVAATKYGTTRYLSIRNTSAAPVTSLPPIVHYDRELEHLQCLSQRISTSTYAACGCQP